MRFRGWNLSDLIEPRSFESKSLEYGLKLANAIREAFGAKALPLSFLKLAELTARRSVDSMAAIAAAGASVAARSGTSHRSRERPEHREVARVRTITRSEDSDSKSNHELA